VALVNANMLGSTAAMLGDWDLQSTLLRRTLQDGALRVSIPEGEVEPLLVDRAEQLHDFQRTMITTSRGPRGDWVSRYVLPPIEDLATEQLMDGNVRPLWLVWTALALTIGAAVAFLQGWPVLGLIFLIVSSPLDIIASRLAVLRLRPLPTRLLARTALWPASGAALLALGWWDARHASSWGAFLAAACAVAFAEATRIEKGALPVPGQEWLVSRRGAMFAAIPFAIFGAWTACVLFILLYAALSFFYVQHARHLQRS
jgi:hypothetical protein